MAAGDSHCLAPTLSRASTRRRVDRESMSILNRKTEAERQAKRDAKAAEAGREESERLQAQANLESHVETLPKWEYQFESLCLRVTGRRPWRSLWPSSAGETQPTRR